MFSGWIKLYRQLRDHELWNAERFTKGQAWVDILLMANYKPTIIPIRGQELHLDRGDLAWSQVSLARRWRWNERTVNRFLAMLQRRQMIRCRINNLTTVISIVNFDEYQKSTELNAEQNADQSTDREEVKEAKENKELKWTKMPVDKSYSLDAFLKEYQKATDLISEEVIEALRYFLDKYESIRHEKHPHLTRMQWRHHVDTTFYCTDNYDNVVDISLSDIKLMIDKYFSKNFDDCDYRLNHFNTDGIKRCLYYELDLYQ